MELIKVKPKIKSLGVVHGRKEKGKKNFMQLMTYCFLSFFN
ncbi:MAG: hypothetical protein OJF59_000697 [Cytophagales bacterium]|nr:MAG: hypothetical protein OJF59_000697 [Cytophagales bacterium]